MKNVKILLVEDDLNLGQTLWESLLALGTQCRWVKSIHEAKKYAHHPDVILLDIGLPDGSGLELAKEVRGLRSDVCLLFLSSDNTPQTRLRGLEIGADDYITKPFALEELVIRLKRLIKRQSAFAPTPDQVEIGKLKICFSRYEVLDAQGQAWPLTQKECSILKLLYQKRNQVVGRDEIIDQVWGGQSYPSNRTVDNYIVKLRKWVDTDKEKPLDIISVRGKGYKLKVVS